MNISEEQMTDKELADFIRPWLEELICRGYSIDPDGLWEGDGIRFYKNTFYSI